MSRIVRRVPVRSFVRENAYRDAWLLILSFLLLFAIISAQQQNKDRISDIQRERVRTTRVNCLDQNLRHDEAVRTTLVLLRKPAVPPAHKLTRAERIAQRQSIITWVSSLVPRRDCARVVRIAVPSRGQ